MNICEKQEGVLKHFMSSVMKNSELQRVLNFCFSLKKQIIFVLKEKLSIKIVRNDIATFAHYLDTIKFIQ